MEQLPEIPNYTIIRKIGEGGYGKVYLAKYKPSGSYVALKIIMTETAARERAALEKYLKIPEGENMAAILDFASTKDFLYYATPLSDSMDDSFSPEDFRWRPKSLQNLISAKLEAPSKQWFLHDEILGIIGPIFDAAISLGKSGLLHRDIKPDNILFFDGKAKLSDFGLVEKDTRSISNIGTPLYAAPSWYVAKGGNPDAYGIAATFYTLISGNLPDTLGRPAYRFPEKEIPEDDRERWLHWHRCILRCAAENPAERFLTLEAFKEAVFSKDFESSKIYSVRKPKGIKKIYIALVALFVFSFAAFKISKNTGDNSIRYEIPEEIYSKIKSEGFNQGAFFIEDIQTWKAQKQSVLEVCEDNLKKSQALAKKSEKQVLKEVEERLANDPLYAPDADKYTEYRKIEIKSALFDWRLARSGLADELENVRNLREAVKGEKLYREYATQSYKKYLDSLK